MNNLQFTLAIPESKAEIIFEAFAKTYGYQNEIDGLPNTESIEMFCRKQVISYITNVTEAYLLNKAKDEAAQAVIAAIDLSGIE